MLILLIFPAIILNHMLLLIIWYFFHNYFWPRPRQWPQSWPRPLPRSSGLGIVAFASASSRRFGLGLEVLASFNINALYLSGKTWGILF